MVCGPRFLQIPIEFLEDSSIKFLDQLNCVRSMSMWKTTTKWVRGRH